MSHNEDTLTALDGHAAKFAKAHATLDDRCASLNAEIADLYRRRLPGIKDALGQVREHQAALLAIVKERPDLFVQPRSIIVRGVAMGYEKSRGSISVPKGKKEIEALVKRALKVLEDGQFDLCFETEYKPRKKALSQLPAATLQKLGCEVHEAGDFVFVRSAVSDVDKLVARLIKAGEKEIAGDAGEDEEAA